MVRPQACATISSDGIPHARAPTETLDVAGDRLDLESAPAIMWLSADAAQLLGHDARLEPALSGETDVLPVAPTASSGVSAGCCYSVRGGAAYIDDARSDEAAVLGCRGHLGPDLLSRDPASHEDDQPSMSSDGLATVRHRGDLEIEVLADGRHVTNHRSMGSRPAAIPRCS